MTRIAVVGLGLLLFVFGCPGVEQAAVGTLQALEESIRQQPEAAADDDGAGNEDADAGTGTGEQDADDGGDDSEAPESTCDTAVYTEK